MCGRNKPDLDKLTAFSLLLIIVSLLQLLIWSTSNSFLTLEGGKSLISHSVAASFLADTETSLSLKGTPEPECSC